MIMKSNFLKNSIIAHRGIYDNKKIVENTIPTFKKAITTQNNIESRCFEVKIFITSRFVICSFYSNKLWIRT
jgi:hypothetical protein